MEPALRIVKVHGRNGDIDILSCKNLPKRINPIGPRGRYNGILFVEKEKVSHEILEDAGIARKHDTGSHVKPKVYPPEAAGKLFANP